MESKKYLTVLGVLAIVSTLAFVGVPFGTDALTLLCDVLFVCGLAAVAWVGLGKKDDKLLMVTALVYVAALFALVSTDEASDNGRTVLAVGFLPGAFMGAVGLLRTHTVCRSKLCYVLNALALLLALGSLVMGLVLYGGFVL